MLVKISSKTLSFLGFLNEGPQTVWTSGGRLTGSRRAEKYNSFSKASRAQQVTPCCLHTSLARIWESMLGWRSDGEKLCFRVYAALKHLFAFVLCQKKSFRCTKHWEQFSGVEVRLPHPFPVVGERRRENNSSYSLCGLGKACKERDRSSWEVGGSWAGRCGNGWGGAGPPAAVPTQGAPACSSRGALADKTSCHQ